MYIYARASAHTLARTHAQIVLFRCLSELCTFAFHKTVVKYRNKKETDCGRLLRFQNGL